MAIKLLRTRAGDDVVSEIEEKDDVITLENPAQLMPMGNPNGQGMQMGFAPWIPFAGTAKLKVDIPKDFIQNQRDAETIARDAGFGIPTYEEKKENWKKAMLDLKGVLDKYNIPFPAIPEVGITGEEISDIDMDDIIPVF